MAFFHLNNFFKLLCSRFNMKKEGPNKGLLIGITLGVVILLIVGFFIFTNRGNTDKSQSNIGNPNLDNTNSSSQASNGLSVCTEMSCFMSSFSSCNPAEIDMPTNDNQLVEITIEGFVNEKCHYTMHMNGILAADCYFNKEDLNEKVLNQMFGNDEGQKEITEAACNP